MTNVRRGTRYFRTVLETWDYRTTEAFVEFVDGVPTRQVTRLDGELLSSNQGHDPRIGDLLTDLELHEGEFPAEAEISAGEFERLWRIATT